MVIKQFPPVDFATEHGLLAIGGDLDVESLLLAYHSGIFPWPHREDEIVWFAPPERAVLFFDELHVPRTLTKLLRRCSMTFVLNHDFKAVIHHCAAAERPKQDGTWIVPDMVGAYCSLHEAGFAHSFECYEGDELVGGMYGVGIGAMFAGESMFFRRPNASKLCLIKAIEFLSSRGCTWMDCQVLTPITETFGAREIARSTFTELLEEAVERRPVISRRERGSL